MSVAIEANSLASLSLLASDPPQYPRNPTHVLREPLVLYIARVPGSRDVFLTPLKPREKVVSAEDITSSLYYLHIDQAEDASMIQGANTARDSREEPAHHEPTGARQANAITRKPVPPARPSADGKSQSFDIPRKLPTSAPVAASPPRKPLGARPLVPRKDAENRHNMAATAHTQDARHMQQDHYSRGSYEDPNRSRNENIDPRDLQFRNPFSADGQHLGARSAITPPYAYPPSRSSGPSVSFTDLQETISSANLGVSLTLIRRDPGSGAQWNVAKIMDGSPVDITSKGHRGVKQPSVPIYIEVLTPGYSKFLYNDEPPPLIARNSGLSAKSVDSVGTGRSMDPRGNPQSGPKVFHRRLWLEGSGRMSNSFSWDRKGSRDCPFSSDERRRSGDFGAPKSYDLEPEVMFANASAGEEYGRSKFRGYVFTSPWSGRCEFTTGHTGKTLKCSHIVPAGPGQGTIAVAAPVSELRFNLPSTRFGRSRSPEKEHSKRHHIFKSRHARNNSSVSSIEAQELHDRLDRLDLSLGQERAGGGFGGKQAKLGKLILEDEGQKMLDLIVAANMGLWWRAYGKADAQKK